MMQKQWLKTSQDIFSLRVDDKETGSLTFHYGTLDRKAIAIIGSKTYEIKRTGFWKNDIEISDDREIIVLKAYAEKWYVNTLVLEYNDLEYQLLIRNNPLAEWAILQDANEILAYGLALDNGKAVLKITGQFDENDLLPDMLLWYLFMPIVQENIADNTAAKMLSGTI